MQQFFLRTTNHTKDMKNVAINLIWRLGGLPIDRDLFRQIGQAMCRICSLPPTDGMLSSADCALGGQPSLVELVVLGHQVTQK